MTSLTFPDLRRSSRVDGKSLRIAFVTETWPPEVNGVATTVARFVAGLHERGHDLQLVRPHQMNVDSIDDIGTPGGDDASARVPSTRSFSEVLVGGLSIPGYRHLKIGLPSRRRLETLWSDERPDLVHIVTEGPLGWSALQAAIRLNIAVSSDFRTNFDSYCRHYRIGWLQQPIATYLRRFHNRADLTMVPTQAIRRELAGKGFRKLLVVGRGVDTALFDPGRRSEAPRHSWGVGPHTPVVMHVGRLAAEKNLSALISTFERVRAQRPRARLVLVGDGPAAADLRASCPHAIFAGIRQQEELATYYASGDLFLFPSLTETYGNVTLEAMASGLAVVAYRYAAAAENIEHGRSGMLADCGDPEQLARLACELVNEPVRMRNVGQRARLHALTLGWGKIVTSLEDALIALASNQRAFI